MCLVQRGGQLTQIGVRWNCPIKDLFKTRGGNLLAFDARQMGTHKRFCVQRARQTQHRDHRADGQCAILIISMV